MITPHTSSITSNHSHITPAPHPCLLIHCADQAPSGLTFTFLPELRVRLSWIKPQRSRSTITQYFVQIAGTATGGPIRCRTPIVFDPAQVMRRTRPHAAHQSNIASGVLCVAATKSFPLPPSPRPSARPSTADSPHSYAISDTRQQLTHTQYLGPPPLAAGRRTVRRSKDSCYFQYPPTVHTAGRRFGHSDVRWRALASTLFNYSVPDAVDCPRIHSVQLQRA